MPAMSMAARRSLCGFPQWDPVDLDAGSFCFGARSDEGWYVGYRPCAQNGHVDLWMKYWECLPPRGDSVAVEQAGRYSPAVVKARGAQRAFDGLVE